MKVRRWVGVLVALALCLPVGRASAAGTAQSAAYGAYYELIQTKAAQSGIISNCAQYFANFNTLHPWENSEGLLYAKLVDFDKNGVDELLLLQGGSVAVQGYVYTYTGGKATLVEELYLTDGSGLDMPYNFQMTLTTGSDGKTYLFDFRNGDFLDYWNYYSLVNGKWTRVLQLERQFVPDIQIGNIASDTGKYTY